MKRVFVSGCYDLLHAGHLAFFQAARALGDHLTVCFASDPVFQAHKHRRSAMPDGHKRAVLESFEMVDEVVVGTDTTLGLDFESHFERLRPAILAVTEDDQFEAIKRELCQRVGAEYIVLPKTPPAAEPISSTEIAARAGALAVVPLRVDLAGSWLDVPQLSRDDAYVVNCAVTPGVTLNDWPYQREAGLGGSAAWAMLQGGSAREFESLVGAGWQDPAVISETGLCVWLSGKEPILDVKRSGDMLAGRLALYWTGPRDHSHAEQRSWQHARDLDGLAAASRIAREAVLQQDYEQLAVAVRQTYAAQLAEGMTPLPEVDCQAMKYCGRGWGGYAVALFADQQKRDAQVAADPKRWRAVEPYCRPAC